MRLAKVLLLTVFLAALTGCSQRIIAVELASDAERIPSPRFTARDLEAVGQIPYYSHIKIYEIDDCEVPHCPVVWHVIVSGKQAPTDIAYGGVPAVGSVTMLPAKQLEKNKTYQIVLEQDRHSRRNDYGSLTFQVDEKGVISPVTETE